MAIGFLEVTGYGTALCAMDKACKATDVKILGIDTINPKDASAFIPLTVQVKFEGNVSNVRIAIEIAIKEALKYNDKDQIVASVIDNPYGEVRRLAEISKVKVQQTL